MKGSRKVEPESHAVSVGRVANIGLKQVYTEPRPPMFKTVGHRAPMHTQTSHKSGSQGKH